VYGGAGGDVAVDAGVFCLLGRGGGDVLDDELFVCTES
jgi:hypothetical protein